MMTFTQLNHGWNADPNAPEPELTVQGSDVAVSFSLNTYQYPMYTKDDMGTLVFHRCHRYCLHSLNDEGFYRGQSRYGKHGVKWGEFYVVENSDWEESLPDSVMVSEQPISEMNHYLFYFRDETLECIAASYEFSICPKKE